MNTSNTSAERRLRVTFGHLQLTDTQTCDRFVLNNTHAEKDSTKIALEDFFDGKYKQIRQKTREIIENNDFEHLEDFDTLSMAEQRAINLKWGKIFGENLPFDFKQGLSTHYGMYSEFVAIATYINFNVMVKFAVQYSLFGGCVVNIGTDRHHQIIDGIRTMKVGGCFGMTEKYHGSNVRGIETTAHYDADTQEFIINTPSRTAHKTWIGGASVADYSSVFAQLYINNEHKGVHCFLVPMKQKGVSLMDCGYKFGLNGIDNMSFSFDHVRIPRVNLLNKFSNVDESGNYSSVIENSGRRFAATIGELVGGRLSLASACNSASKVCLRIAFNYATTRLQFAPAPNQPEVPIMTYPTHSRRLMPLLARTVANTSYLEHCTELYDNKEHDTQACHSEVSVLKALVSWNMVKTLDICRQCCGGAGYRAPNRISGYIRDTHIAVTFEGDNTVLVQQTVKYLLAQMHQEQDFSKVTVSDLSVDSLIKVLKCREMILLQQLQSNLKNKRNEGQDDWHSFNDELNLVLRVGLAHGERVLQEQFVKRIENIKDEKAKSILRQFADLNGLYSIVEDLGFFVTRDLISKGLALTTEDDFGKKCRKLAQVAQVVVDAFNIPEKCLPKDDLSDY
ncbi:Acx [Acrasis kona]|uniref:Acyl-coenzyme A oxidase n=1 Tax=Acrasis kona TaxID=1008807 RepID=A0AAW2YK67_9EUKA